MGRYAIAVTYDKRHICKCTFVDAYSTILSWIKGSLPKAKEAFAYIESTPEALVEYSGGYYIHIDYDRKLIYWSNVHPLPMLARIVRRMIFDYTIGPLNDSQLWKPFRKHVDIEAGGWKILYKVKACPSDYGCNSSLRDIEAHLAQEEQSLGRELERRALEEEPLFLVELMLSARARYALVGKRVWLYPIGKCAGRTPERVTSGWYRWLLGELTQQELHKEIADGLWPLLQVYL